MERDQRIVAALLGGAGLLLVELRYEHRQALGETRLSWIPLIYAAALLLFGSFALLRWHSGGRRALAALFAVGMVVGLAGLWFHTGAHPLKGVLDVLAAWRVPLGQDGGIKIGSRPPALAPLAFCGLGTLGWLLCAGPRQAR